MLSPPGAGFAGTTILQPAVYEKTLLSSLFICFKPIKLPCPIVCSSDSLLSLLFNSQLKENRIN